MKAFILVCMLLAAISLQLGQARPTRALLQSSSTSSEAQAASWVSANLTGSSPNAQAASFAVAQAAAFATASGHASTDLASAFVSALVQGDATSGNATAQAYALALTNTSGNSNNQETIVQAYSSAVLSFYEANNIEVRSASDCLAFLSLSLSAWRTSQIFSERLQ